MRTSPLYLVGMPGVGKTTIGKSLAERLGFSFYDLDHAIEAKVGMPIGEYFAQAGQEAFRKAEAEELRKTSQMPPNTIVSTGGGTAAWHNNMDWMLTHGLVIWLTADQETLLTRLSRNQSKRPLLAQKSMSELQLWIENTLREREPWFTLAHVQLSTEQGKAPTVEKILSHYQSIRQDQ